MPGAMRKMGVYLGLVEDEDEFIGEAGETYAALVRAGRRSSAGVRPTRAREPTTHGTARSR